MCQPQPNCVHKIFKCHYHILGLFGDVAIGRANININKLTQYHILGLFGDVAIGRANAKDADDWDYVEKNYYFIGPKAMKRFFR